MTNRDVPQPANSESIEVFTACLPRDLHLLRLAVDGLHKNISVKSVSVATSKNAFRQFKSKLGSDIILLDQDELIPEFTLQTVRKMKLPGFPRGAGWYFQQLLKLGYGLLPSEGTRYLIWDADTVLLRPIKLFDEAGRTYITKAHENHPPYFETYKRLFGRAVEATHSLIAQHMVINKAFLREMLSEMERHRGGADNWAWKIMHSLRGTDTNLFSEYETYGNYVLQRYPGEITLRELSWSRDGTRFASFHPTARDLKRLAERFDFVAFESSQVLWRRAIRGIKATCSSNG